MLNLFSAGMCVEMYQKFFGLKEPPFRVDPDPRFLYFSPSHARARDYLEFALDSRDGIIVITGQPGCGKSALIADLRRRADAADVLLIDQTQLNSRELLQTLLLLLGHGDGHDDRPTLRARVRDALRNCVTDGRRLTLVVDEAQLLPLETLEELRMLGDQQYAGTRLLGIVLVGQPELARRLRGPGCEQFRQRVRLWHTLRPLTRAQTRRFVEHRLKIAGPDHRIRFSPRAIDRIHRGAGGLPRLINMLADMTLTAAALEETRVVEARLVEEAMRELACTPRGSAWRWHFDRLRHWLQETAQVARRGASRALAAVAALPRALSSLGRWREPLPGTASVHGASETPVRPFVVLVGFLLTAVLAQSLLSPPREAAAPAVVENTGVAASRIRVAEALPGEGPAGTSPPAPAIAPASAIAPEHAIATAPEHATAQTTPAPKANRAPKAEPIAAVGVAAQTAENTAAAATPPTTTSPTTGLPSTTPPATTPTATTPTATAPTATAPTATAATATAATATPPPTATTPGGAAHEMPRPLEGEDWLLAQPDDTYLVQLFAATAPDRIGRFLRAQPAGFAGSAQLAAFATLRDDSPWYVLVMGPYEGYSVGRRAIGQLPGSVRRLQPWVRRTDEIQSAIAARGRSTSDALDNFIVDTNSTPP